MSGAKIIEGLKEAVELAREGKTMREPPKRWCNWWGADPYTTFIDVLGNTATADERGMVMHPAVHPSKDIAEAVALEAITKLRANGIQPGEYLGAFPEGERP